MLLSIYFLDNQSHCVLFFIMRKEEGNILSENLKSLMKSQSLNQVQLAKISGIDQGRISRILKGEYNEVSLPTLTKLKSALRVSYDTLISEETVYNTPTLDVWGEAYSKRPGWFYAKDFQVNQLNKFRITVVSDNMSPLIPLNSNVVINTVIKVNDNNVCFIKLKNNIISIRRFHTHDRTFSIFSSDNPNYKLEMIKKEKIKMLYPVYCVELI